MLGRDDDQGIMVQALTELFYLMGQTQDELIYRVTMSYLEVSYFVLDIFHTCLASSLSLQLTLPEHSLPCAHCFKIYIKCHQLSDIYLHHS